MDLGTALTRIVRRAAFYNCNRSYLLLYAERVHLRGFWASERYNGIMNTCNCNLPIGAIQRVDKLKCPHKCVLPLVEIANADGIKNLAACFVHVLSTNTTYYIDERGRMVVTWQGDLFIDNYDYANNPLNLRAQKVYDFVNNREVIYDAHGQYRLATLTEV